MIISLPSYTGEAALVDNVLAHQGPKGLFVVGRNYTIDSVNYVVLSSTPSQYVPSITLVKLKEL